MLFSRDNTIAASSNEVGYARLEYYKSKNCIVVTLDQMVATSLQ